MGFARTPLLLGLALVAAGAWLLAHGWGRAVGGDLGPGALGFLSAGVLLGLLGLLMVGVPLLVPILYRIYGEQAFASRGGACPVVQKCLRCGEFTFRGKPACKACGAPLGAQT